MSHESPPQQHSCLSDAVAPALDAPSFFMSHESPQHSCLSDAVAPTLDAPSFFLWHESPQQLSCVCVAAVFMLGQLFILHESPLQQPVSIAQQDSAFLSCAAF